jgi:hypothetical protein
MPAGSSYPRVLFITPHAFNHVSGGGITYSNLFRGWPQDALATVHNDHEPTSGDVCKQYFVLGAAELSLAPPLSTLHRVMGRSAAAGGPSVPTAFAGHPPSGARRGRLGRLPGQLAGQILGSTMPERATLTPRLAAWIKAFRPDVIYTILGSNGMMRLIREIRLHFHLPVVVHFMDDWMAASHRHGLLGPAMRRDMLQLVAEAVETAERCLGISPAMCAEFSQRFGRPFEAFQNTIEVSRWSTLAKTGLRSGTPADVLYVGSIFPNAQLDSLAQCCRAVAELNRQGMPATLTISSPSGHAERYRSRLAIDRSIRIIDTIRDDETYFKRIAAADLLLLPVNFDTDSVRFIRYSMPTKVPSYLAVGTPIFAYGPSDTAQMKYAISDEWAFTLNDPSLATLVSGLRNALTNEPARIRISTAARCTALRNHDASTVRIRFHDVLREAAGRKALP